jgi:hypothetical protein
LTFKQFQKSKENKMKIYSKLTKVEFVFITDMERLSKLLESEAIAGVLWSTILPPDGRKLEDGKCVVRIFLRDHLIFDHESLKRAMEQVVEISRILLCQIS